MPYKSDAQRRYMHAQHPEIAAKWDAEIRRKKKSAAVSKKDTGWLKAIGAGTVAGGLANQFTHVEVCSKGHRYDEENTYHRPQGGRGCKQCVRDRSREYQRRRRALQV